VHDVASPLALGRGELLLVVDDEEAIREIARVTLESHGYRVLTAADGAEAVAIYEQAGQDIRAVVTDMMMPQMDGVATIHALRALNPQVQIIAASGLTDTDRRAEEVGARYMLRKPYTAAELLGAVSTILAGSRPPGITGRS
jgi:CheY-like chemotaxis protein